ncbi:MAG TPA: GNAT family N-acetyltransferase [Burkholderiaceae bacterium]
MIEPDIRLVEPSTPAQWDALRALLREYAGGLGVDLSYQDFEGELAALPGAYAPPGGLALLAMVDGAPAGCVAMRPRPDLAASHPRACEMKRLYARPRHRGLGLGRRLAEALVARAGELGYRILLLDTLPDMHAAQALYAGLGFQPVPPYYPSPVAGTLFLRRALP